MSLTIGSGPLGERPAGRFNTSIEAPGGLLYFEDNPRRIRAIFAKQTVVDSNRVKLLHESGRLPVYYFPEQDVRRELLEPSERNESSAIKGTATYWSLRVGDRVSSDAVWSWSEPLLAGHVALEWDAMDEWFAEDEQLFGHPRDPYSRIDVHKSSRHVRVSRDGVVLADTRRSRILFETALPPRHYIPAPDVRTELLVPSSTKTRCAYKGSATHWSVRIGDRIVDDLVWSYPQPQHDAQPVRDLLCFYNERVDIELDGEPVPRPQTQWSRDEE
ncbi:MAG: DUF427 domain-containing protein [Actinobacteria bacterium]|nr:DUF427 domain-containing protein [Actinomycetota bacterium]